MISTKKCNKFKFQLRLCNYDFNWYVSSWKHTIISWSDDPSGTETAIFQDDQANTMAIDSLAPCVAKTSATAIHYSDVMIGAMASQSTSLTIIKENIKAPRHWPLCGEFTCDRWIPSINGQWRGKYFHLMTSSFWYWYVIFADLFITRCDQLNEQLEALAVVGWFYFLLTQSKTSCLLALRSSHSIYYLISAIRYFRHLGPVSILLHWRYNERNGVSNHQHIDCLHSRLTMRTSRKHQSSALPAFVRGPSQRVTNEENVSILWCHHEQCLSQWKWLLHVKRHPLPNNW